MHAIILAAGFGDRMGELGRRPKALLPLGNGCVLDKVVESLWVDGINVIHVVHNDAVLEWEEKNAGGFPVRKRLDWRREFKRWVKNLRWEPEEGRNREFPQLRLHNSGVKHREDLRGAVADLAHVVRKVGPPRNGGFIVACCDNLFRHPYLDKLTGSDSGLVGDQPSAITCRHVSDLDPSVLASKPDSIRWSPRGMAGILKTSVTPWCFCGPFFLSRRDVPFLLEYVDYHDRSGERADSIGEFFAALCEDAQVRMVRVRDPKKYYDVGTPQGYAVARKIFVSKNEKLVHEAIRKHIAQKAASR